MRTTRRLANLALVALDTAVAAQAILRDPHSKDPELTKIRDSALKLAETRLDKIPPLSEGPTNSGRRK